MNPALLMAVLAVLLLILEVPVSIALGLSATITILIFKLGPLLLVAQQILGALDSFTLLAIPLFLVAGNLLGHGETSHALIKAARRLTRRIPGGLGFVAVQASLLLAGISGSGPADVAALSLVLFAPLVREGYKREDAAALLAAGGGIGIIIPPSIALILFGLVGEVSVERLFLAGVFPGLLIAASLYAVVVLLCKPNLTVEPEPASEPQGGLFYSLIRSLGALGAPVLMLGGLYSGLFADATEAATVVIVYVLVLEMVLFRSLRWSNLRETIQQSVRTSAQVLWLVACASIFAWVLHRTGATLSLASWIAETSGGPLVFLLFVNVALLLLGCVVDAVSLLYIFTPIFIHAARQLGVNEIHLGIVMVVNLAIGQVTPPVGVNLFVASSTTGLEVSQVARAAFKFVLAELVALVVIVLWPGLSLWLPSQFVH